MKKGYRIEYGYDILKSLTLGYYILKISCSKKGQEISFLEIFGYRIGYKYPLIYILPVSGWYVLIHMPPILVVLKGKPQQT
jgi:hypothetical protein